ncbi:ankyrin repeat domain-containing protein [Wolbachia endosymbiont (group B) of Elophila nymphaeata]
MRDELTLLHIAAEYSNEKVVQALLGAGASVNAVDSCGRTP